VRCEKGMSRVCCGKGEARDSGGVYVSSGAVEGGRMRGNKEPLYAVAQSRSKEILVVVGDDVRCPGKTWGASGWGSTTSTEVSS
jgi:hypothetical protein